MSVAPGWYPDPADPGTTRYWDGEGWAEQPAADKPATEAAAGTPGAAQTTQTAPLPPVAGPAQPGGYSVPGPMPGSVAGGAPAGRAPGAPPGPGQQPLWWPEDVAYPPTAPVTPFGLQLASPGRRLGARAIDLGVLTVLNLIFNGWFLFQWFRESMLLGQEWLRTGELDPASAARINELALIISLIAFALWFAYEVPVTHSRGQTLGKILVGVRVIPMEGPGRLSFYRSFRRWLYFGAPLAAFACCGIFGFVLPLIDNLFVATDRYLHLAWHDRSVRTYVVQVPARNAPLK